METLPLRPKAGIPAPGGAPWSGSDLKPFRHAVLRVRSDAWRALLADRADLAAEPLLTDWAARDRPLIARRRDPRDRPGCVAAGLPLPPAYGKRRIRLELASTMLVAIEPPPSLETVLATAPKAWTATIEAVCALGRRIGSRPRVFGSFAWGAMTGLAYVGPQSDLDLLWPLTPETDVDALTGGLAALDRAAPGRLDGELLQAASGAAVNWRELHQGADMVLVKTIDAAQLRPAAWFRGSGIAA